MTNQQRNRKETLFLSAIGFAMFLAGLGIGGYFV